jgi:3,4-dihydroxy 2-butanone 4-phosphate synthase/GTP cyclohydrolase II
MVPIERWLAGAAVHRQLYGRPLVTLSYAQSLDGSLAARRGCQLKLSGPDSLRLTHRLRAAHDAILVGIGTVTADNPRLTVRLAPGKDPQPVILDSRLQIPLQSSLLTGGSPVWIATQEAHSSDPGWQRRASALEAAGARLLPLPTDNGGRISLVALLRKLAELGICSLMVEGGARTITSFLSQGLVDQVVITVAPVFVGGLHAVSGLYGESEPETPTPAIGKRVDAFLRLESPGYQVCGEDLIIWGKISGKINHSNPG